EHGAGTDLVGDPGDGVDLLVPDLGRQVDGDEVPLLGGSLDTDEAAEPLPQLVQLGVDVGVGDLRRLDGQRDRGQVGDLELGTDIDLGLEDELAAGGTGQVRNLGDVDAGLAHRPH